MYFTSHPGGKPWVRMAEGRGSSSNCRLAFVTSDSLCLGAENGIGSLSTVLGCIFIVALIFVFASVFSINTVAV